MCPGAPHVPDIDMLEGTASLGGGVFMDTPLGGGGGGFCRFIVQKGLFPAFAAAAGLSPLVGLPLCSGCGSSYHDFLHSPLLLL